MTARIDSSIVESRCPLCGDANACVMAATGSDVGDCWCTAVRVDAALIARVPSRLRGLACICAACVAAAPPSGER